MLNLDLYRKIGDAIADDFVLFYFSNKALKLKLDESLKQLQTNSDWSLFIKNIPEAIWFDDEFNQNLPLNTKLQQAAITFYKKRESYILQLLGLLSLPYCYAAADGAKVLYQTERMYKDIGKRLEETAAFVKAMMNPKAFNDEGDGKVQLFKVRVMHAAARFYLKQSFWDHELGFPINQEDMVGTNLSFSIIVIRGLRKMGFTVSETEQLSYIRYWSWIGANLGVNLELLPQNGKEAHHLEKLISQRQFKTSDHGVLLTQSLLKYFYQLNDEKQIKNHEIAGFMRFLLGDKVADLLVLSSGNFPLPKQILLRLKISIS